jgi:hypothetical protein
MQYTRACGGNLVLTEKLRLDSFHSGAFSLAPPPCVLPTTLARLPPVRQDARRRRGGGDGRGHPAPRQGASLAPWNPLLNSYIG